MTENLRLAGPKTLTATDSNVSADFTLSASNTGTWCTSDESACDDQSMSMDSGNTNYGFYYNWYAATAGTGTYSVSSSNVSSSICPKGWRLPTGGDSGEFNTLYTSYGSSATNLLSEIGPAFVLSGNRGSDSAYNQDRVGFYWSSTARNSNSAHDLYLNSSDVYPATYYNKYVGFSVRCVVQ